MLFPTIEFTGYSKKLRLDYMKHIFNSDQMSEVDQKLGKSIYFLNIFTE